MHLALQLAVCEQSHSIAQQDHSACAVAFPVAHTLATVCAPITVKEGCMCLALQLAVCEQSHSIEQQHHSAWAIAM